MTAPPSIPLSLKISEKDILWWGLAITAKTVGTVVFLYQSGRCSSFPLRLRSSQAKHTWYLAHCTCSEWCLLFPTPRIPSPTWGRPSAGLWLSHTTFDTTRPSSDRLPSCPGLPRPRTNRQADNFLFGERCCSEAPPWVLAVLTGIWPVMVSIWPVGRVRSHGGNLVEHAYETVPNTIFFSISVPLYLLCLPSPGFWNELNHAFFWQKWHLMSFVNVT